MFLFLTETGAPMNMIVLGMQLCSENKADFSKLLGSLGRYLQIRDDFCNLCVREVTMSYVL
jgi:hypothetical protein